MPPLVKVTMWGFKCLRCEHQWIPRGLEQVAGAKKPAEPEEEPKVCPKCKSPYWNRERQR